MKKLLKYEYETSKKPMFQILIIFTIISFIMQGYIRLNMFSEEYLTGNDFGAGAMYDGSNIIYGLFTIIFILVAAVGIIGATIAFYLRLSNIFRKDIYGDEGYFIFSLPVNGYKITISKVLIALFWSSFLMFVLLVVNIILAYSLFYLFGNPTLREMIIKLIKILNFNQIFNIDTFIYLLSNISSMFFVIAVMFSAIILDYKIGRKKQNSQMWIIYAILIFAISSFFVGALISPDYSNIFSSVKSGDSFFIDLNFTSIRIEILLEIFFNFISGVLLTIFVGHNTDKKIEKL